MIPTVVLTAAAAVFVSAVVSRWRNRRGLSARKVYADRDSFEVLANDLKAAATKVDNSAARVEVALQPLMAA